MEIDDPNIALYQSIRSSNEICPAVKSGLEQTQFWYELRKKYPDPHDRIPELNEQAQAVTDGMIAQVNHFYTGKEKSLRLDGIYLARGKWQVDRRTYGDATLTDWYCHCISLAKACSPFWTSDTTKEILSRIDHLANNGFVVALIYPTQENLMFDGILGEAAIVSGIITNVWLGGLSARPDMMADGLKSDPLSFLWHDLAAHSFQFMFTHVTLNQLDYQNKLKQLPQTAATDEVYRWLFNWLHEDLIGIILPDKLDLKTFVEFFRICYTPKTRLEYEDDLVEAVNFLITTNQRNLKNIMVVLELFHPGQSQSIIRNFNFLCALLSKNKDIMAIRYSQIRCISEGIAAENGLDASQIYALFSEKSAVTQFFTLITDSSGSYINPKSFWGWISLNAAYIKDVLSQTKKSQIADRIFTRYFKTIRTTSHPASDSC